MDQSTFEKSTSSQLMLDPPEDESEEDGYRDFNFRSLFVTKRDAWDSLFIAKRVVF
jgi:hypothetical protein